MGMKNSFIIEHVNIFLEKEVISSGSIYVKSGKIKTLSHDYIEPEDDDVEVIDGAGLNLVPGFIDGHIHGAYGYDVMDDDDQALRVMAESFHVKERQLLLQQRLQIHSKISNVLLKECVTTNQKMVKRK